MPGEVIIIFKNTSLKKKITFGLKRSTLFPVFPFQVRGGREPKSFSKAFHSFLIGLYTSSHLHYENSCHLGLYNPAAVFFFQNAGYSLL